jgi:plastocyanin
MTATLTPPAPPTSPPPQRRPTTLVILAAIAVLAVIALGVVGVAAIRNGRSDRVTTTMGGGRSSANMPGYSRGPGGMVGNGTMMGGGSMMGGKFGSTSPVVPGAREIAIQAKSDRFNPSEIHVKIGEIVTISLTATDEPHDFTVDALRVQIAATAGQTVRGALQAPATPGRYPFYCSVPGHRQAGMTGTLVVDPAS